MNGDDLIRAIDENAIHKVDLPGDQSTYVRVLNLAEYESMERDFVAANRTDFRARLIIASCCDEFGVNWYKVDDLDRVRRMPANFAVHIANKSLSINQFTEETETDLKKGSGEVTGNNSSSD